MKIKTKDTMVHEGSTKDDCSLLLQGAGDSLRLVTHFVGAGL